jgi:hypothetical protein
VPFILPRTFLSAQRKRKKIIDGTATILLSHIVEDIDCCESESSISPMDIEVNSHSSDNLMTDGDASMRYIEKSSSKSSGVCSMDVPFDAHMLPGRGRRLYAILPLLCIADEENIAPLLSSVLYQRRVWGIDEPAVGLVFSKTGTIGRIILGWLDLESTNDSDYDLVRDQSG